MAGNFLEEFMQKAFNVAHSQKTVNHAREALNMTGDLISKAAENAAELAKTNSSRSINVNVSPVFNFGSGTVVNVLPGPEGAKIKLAAQAAQVEVPKLLNQNSPTACLSDAWLGIEDMNIINHTMLVLGGIYGFFLYKESLNIYSNSLETLSSNDSNLLESEIAFWYKFKKLQDFDISL